LPRGPVRLEIAGPENSPSVGQGEEAVPGARAAFSNVTFCRHIAIYADIMSHARRTKGGLSALRASKGEPRSHRARFGFDARSRRSPISQPSTSQSTSSVANSTRSVFPWYSALIVE